MAVRPGLECEVGERWCCATTRLRRGRRDNTSRFGFGQRSRVLGADKGVEKCMGELFGFVEIEAVAAEAGLNNDSTCAGVEVLDWICEDHGGYLASIMPMKARVKNSRVKLTILW